ncbi:MAG: succinylglutamate desuccinylase/aspartoacylase family protein [Thermosynechococcaceae cyanobacterium]
MEEATAIQVGDTTVNPGQRQQIDLPVARLPTQTMLSLPVTVINGTRPGPRLWLSAAIHGDELNGVDIIRQVLAQVKPKTLCGTLIAVPIVNIFGFIEQSRYLPDRRDLNRSFPGSTRGSLAGRLAHLFMTEVVSHCTHGIDLHTAANHRTNWPQIRANLDDPETYRCAKAFNAPLMLHSNTRDGSLRQAAAQQGIPILLYEAGEALRFDAYAIQVGVIGVLQVMAMLEMLPERPMLEQQTKSLELRESRWVRASRSGILHRHIELGQQVTKRQHIGSISDTLGSTNIKVYAPFAGVVIGHTQHPLVNQGDGIFHIARLLDGA